MSNMNTETQSRIESWVALLSVSSPQFKFGYEIGSRYARVWKQIGKRICTDTVAFVDLASGQIHTPNQVK